MPIIADQFPAASAALQQFLALLNGTGGTAELEVEGEPLAMQGQRRWREVRSAA
jgi:hypothetical protein